MIIRVLLIGQAAFLIAFNYTLAMKHCSVHTSALRLEAKWATAMAMADLVTLPLIFVWRQFAVDEYPSPGF